MRLPSFRIPAPLWWVALGVLAFAAGVVLMELVLLPWVAHRGQETRVPDLASMTQAQAETAAREAGLVLRVRAQQFDTAVPRGCVLLQDPPGGVMARRGRAVEVVVSLGEEKSAMPPLRGQDFREAQMTLGRLGLQAGSVARVYSEEVPADRVLASDPGPDSPIPQDRPVSVLMSLGPEPRRYLVPDWVGSRVREVTATLDRAGIRYTLSGHDVALGGAVLSQNPPPGSQVRTGDLVVLGTGRAAR